MAIQELMITPTKATELLNRNTNNRKLSTRRASALAEKMRQGEWQYNGDTIRISKTGVLLDGQHRLTAIEISGMAQRQILVDDLDDEAFTTIDIGSARKASQMIEMDGQANATTLAAATKLYLMYTLTGRPIHGNPDKGPSPTQIVRFAHETTELQEAVAYCVSRKWLVKYVTASAASFCCYVFGLTNKEKTAQFLIELESGEFSYHDSSVKIIRDLLIEERGSKRTTDRLTRMGMMFKAFRLFSEGKTAKLLRMPKNPDDWFLLT